MMLQNVFRLDLSITRPWRWLLCAGLLLPTGGAAWADVVSGPEVGTEVAPLKVWGVVGEVNDQEADITERRGAEPTVVVFVNKQSWGRPIARFLSELDKKLHDTAPKAQVVIVWLTDDVQGAKDYLPKAQGSLKLANSSWTVFPGAPAGPDGWAINDKADVTTVITSGGKVAARLAYVSVNETLVPEVLSELKKAAEQ